VTTVIRRPAAAVVVLAIAALLLAACGSGPSQVNAALIVGNTTVSVDQVQHELNGLLASQAVAQQAQQSGKLDEVSRAVVTSHVLHVLAGQAATRYGLVVTDQQVDQLISQSGGAAKVAAGLLVDPANVRDGVRDFLVEIDLARKYADTLKVTLGFVAASDRPTAVRDAQRLAADPGALKAMVSAAAAASGGQGGGQTSTQLSASSYLQTIAQQQAQQAQQQQGAPTSTENDGPVFGAPANSVIAFQPNAAAGGGWIVAIILSRDLGAGGSQSAAASDPTTLHSLGVSLLEQEATDVGVRISPRYGVWNLADMSVAASDDQTASVEIPVQHAKP
jgi:hypothetical protein